MMRMKVKRFRHRQASGQEILRKIPLRGLKKMPGLYILYLIMAEQNKKKMSSGAPASSKRWRLVLLLFVVPLVLIAGIVLGCRALNRVWFTDNRHLILRKVHVLSSGYWSGRDDELAARLHLKPGTGMFRIDPAEVRRGLEKIPCVSKARVYRELPDTLRIELNERVPRAIIGNRNSQFVADENAVLMLRRESMASGKMELPIITGIRLNNHTPGGTIPAARPALKLIMLAMQDFPVYNIAVVSILPGDSMACYLSYRNGKSLYRVIVPADPPDPAMLFRALEAAIIEVKRAGDRQRNFNLTYDGQVVIK